jgi:hypothetical protein
MRPAAPLWKVVLVVITIGVSQSIAAQFTSYVFRDKFDSPISLMWFKTSLMVLLGAPLASQRQRARGADDPSREPFAHAAAAEVNGASVVSLVTRSDSLGAPLDQDAALEPLPPIQKKPAGFFKSNSVRRIATLTVFFYVLSTASNASYILSLQRMAPSLVSGIFCAAPAFVCFLSVFVLSKKLELVEVLSLCAGVGGVLLIVKPWAISNKPGAVGLHATLIAVVSPITAALYKVFFSKYFTGCSWMEVCAVLGLIGVASIVIGLPVVAVGVTELGLEPSPLSAPNGIPWGTIVGSTVAHLIFDVAVNFGVTIAYPFWMSVGSLLTTALNILYDALTGVHTLDPYEVGGIIGVTGSLGLLIGGEIFRLRAERLAEGSNAIIDACHTQN